jgi:N-methylhydantoinase A
MPRSSLRVAIDIGGTFVDAISFDASDHSVRTWKSPTTPHRPSVGVLEAIRGLRYPLSEVGTIVHGTTLGLNAILQRKGAAVGLITNAGFEDVLEIARAEVMPHAMYDFNYVPPPPVVPRRFRRGVPGRIGADGTVVTPLDEDAVVKAAVSLVRDDDREALAVCFLHSYANPDHEGRAGEVIKAALPEVAVSLSIDVAREYREYERTSTTVLDAFIRPVLSEYFGKIEQALRADGFRGSLHVMRSGGGAMTVQLAQEAPLTTVLSGPAGGIAGSAWIGREAGLDRLLSFDVGGTSADTCVLQDGAPHHAYEARIDRLPLLLQVFDIRTIGAGGGSIAQADAGLLKVGPTSAGAVPGPACYGAGGSQATVTDAAVVLGMISGDEFLDGRMPLDETAAAAAIQRIADELGMSPVDAAAGIIRVAVARTVGALREITTERGLDPRDFALLAFGGAGPLLGPIVSGEMDLARTIVPRDPALFSAWGMLTSDLEYSISHGAVVPLDAPDSMAEVRKALAELEAAVTGVLRERFGAHGGQTRVHQQVDVRYRGQEFGISVDVDPEDSAESLADRFAMLHQQRHGHGIPEHTEVVACRVRGVVVIGKPALEDVQPPVADSSPAPGQQAVNARPVYDFATSQSVQTPVYRRDDLTLGSQLRGPAVITEGTSTTVVPSDQLAEIDDAGLLRIQRVR